MAAWQPWLALLGMACIESSYLTQIARLFRIKEAEEISLWFPSANLFGRLLAITYTLSRHDIVLAAGFALGVALRTVFLSQVVYYRYRRRKLGYGQGFSQAIRDLVSGAHNRKYLLEQLRSELAQVRRRGGGFSLAFFRVEGPSPLQPTLRAAARALERMVRAGESFARVQDGVFAVMLRETRHDALHGVTERLRLAMKDACGDGVSIAAWTTRVDDRVLGEAEHLLDAGLDAQTSGVLPAAEISPEAAAGS
ncbi:MAG TPA: hypothetical protein VF765_09260 [Polyangiaceae bacterium]